jgi:DNA-binding transcriptional ArsR family regulator
MITDPVAILFNDKDLVRVLRRLIAASEITHKVSELVICTGVPSGAVQKSLRLLQKANIVKVVKRKSATAYQLNESSPIIEPLKGLIRYDVEINKKNLKQEFKGVGTIRNLVFSGHLTENSRVPLDVLVVGSNIDETKLKKALKLLGYKTGYELRYLQLEPKELQDRLEMSDRVLRNVTDFSHIEVIGQLK